MIIDFHTNIGEAADLYCDPDELLKEMDDNDVQQAVVCPTDRYMAVFNEEGNSYITETVNKHPERFIGFGCASPWYGSKAVEEVKKIKNMGLKGIKFHPFIQGFMLSDKFMDPVLEACAKQSLVVMVHTGTPISSMPFQLKEVALRFPEIKFIMGHMGWSDFWYDAALAAKDLPNIYLEISYQMPSVIKDAIQVCGAERVVYGSDWPYSRMRIELNKVRVAPTVAAKNDILALNAKRIMAL
jgi:predicted TIM-barrel fold metal-dependent hydrolase